MSEEKSAVLSNDAAVSPTPALKDVFGASRPAWAPTAERFASAHCTTTEAASAFVSLLREICGHSVSVVAPAAVAAAAEATAMTELPPWVCVMRGVSAITPRARVDLYFCADAIVLDAKGKFTALPYTSIAQVIAVPSANALETIVVFALAPGQPALSGKTKVPVVVLKFPADATLAASPLEPSPDCAAALDLATAADNAGPGSAPALAGALSAAAATYRAPLAAAAAAAAGGLPSVKAADAVASLVSARTACGSVAKLPTGSPGPLPCYYKAADGHLYVLRAGALFLGRPPLFVPVGRIGDLTTKQAGPSNVDLVLTVTATSTFPPGAAAASAPPAAAAAGGGAGEAGGRLELQMLPKAEAGVLSELARYVAAHRQRTEKKSAGNAISAAEGAGAAEEKEKGDGGSENDVGVSEAAVKRPRPASSASSGAGPNGAGASGSAGGAGGVGGRRSVRAAALAASAAPMIDSEDDGGSSGSDDDAYGEDDAAADGSDSGSGDEGEGDEGDSGSDSDSDSGSGSGSGSDGGYVSDTDEELSGADDDDSFEAGEIVTGKRGSRGRNTDAVAPPAPALVPAAATAVTAVPAAAVPAAPAPTATSANASTRPGAPLTRPGQPLTRPGAPLSKPGAPLGRPGAPLFDTAAATTAPEPVSAPAYAPAPAPVPVPAPAPAPAPAATASVAAEVPAAAPAPAAVTPAVPAVASAALAEVPAAVATPAAAPAAVPAGGSGVAGSVDAFRAFLQSKQRKDA